MSQTDPSSCLSVFVIWWPLLFLSVHAIRHPSKPFPIDQLSLATQTTAQGTASRTTQALHPGKNVPKRDTRGKEALDFSLKLRCANKTDKLYGEDATVWQDGSAGNDHDQPE